MQRGGIGSGEVAHGNRAQPQCADDFLQVWRDAGVVVPRLLHRDDVLLRLLAQRAMVLVGDGFEQRADARGVVVQPEVGGGEHGHGLATALVEVGEDADQVARFLRVGGDEHLFFEQAQQVRRVGPRFGEFPALAFLLGGRHVEQAEGFGDVLRDQRFDGAAGDLQAVVEQAVQQHPAAIQLDALGAAARLEVDGDRVDAMHLLVGVAAAVAHRDHQHQQVGALLGDLRKNLDEVERPVLPRVLLGVGEAVVPRLELIQQQHRRFVLKQLDDELVRRNFRFGRTLAVPLTLDEGAVRMVFEQDIPQEFVAVAMQAFADDVHPVSQGDLADAGVGQRGCPGIEPRACRDWVGDCVVQRCHQVRLTEAAFADHDHGASLAGADGLDAFQQVVRGVGDLQKLLGCDLGRACVLVVGQLDGCALEALAPEFFS